jgi:hypothetical protein
MDSVSTPSQKAQGPKRTKGRKGSKLFTLSINRAAISTGGVDGIRGRHRVV